MKNGLKSHISIKPTQLGLDLDEALCRENLRRVLEKAKEHEIFVRIDMECSTYTQKTLDLFEALYLNIATSGWSSNRILDALSGT